MKWKSVYTITLWKKNKLNRKYAYNCWLRASITVYLYILILKISSSKMDVNTQSKELGLITDDKIEEIYLIKEKMNVNKKLLYQLFSK